MLRKLLTSSNPEHLHYHPNSKLVSSKRTKNTVPCAHPTLQFSTMERSQWKQPRANCQPWSSTACPTIAPICRICTMATNRHSTCPPTTKDISNCWEVWLPSATRSVHSCLTTSSDRNSGITMWDCTANKFRECWPWMARTPNSVSRAQGSKLLHRTSLIKSVFGKVLMTVLH